MPELFARPKTFQEVPLELPEDLEAVYANRIAVQVEASRFLLDFAQALPGCPAPRVRARVAIAPWDALLLTDLLYEHALSFEDTSSHSADTGGRSPTWRPSPAPAPVAPPGLPVVPGNLMSASWCGTEFLLDFLYLFPNGFRALVSARLVLPAGCLRGLAEALEEALSAFSARYGPLPEPAAVAGAPALRDPAGWGLSIPFALS